MYTENNVLSFWGHTIFSSNSAQNSTGGIYSKNSALMFSGSTSFSSNSGQSLGGGIYGFGTLLYFIGSSSFTCKGWRRHSIFSLRVQISLWTVTMQQNMEEQCMWEILIPFFTVFLIGQIWRSASFKLMDLTEFFSSDICNSFFSDPAASLHWNESIGHEVRAILNISINY